MKNLGQMMKQAQKLQEKMGELQEQLAQAELVGSSGGGMVQVTLSGKRRTAPAENRSVAGRPRGGGSSRGPNSRRVQRRQIEGSARRRADGGSHRRASVAPRKSSFRSEPATRIFGRVGEIVQLGLRPPKRPRSIDLIQQLAKLPGLGPRSAMRAALFMLKRRETVLEPLARALAEAAMRSACVRSAVISILGILAISAPTRVGMHR